MPELPKLKIKLPFGPLMWDYCSLDEAKHRFDFIPETLVSVEGQLIHSYEELVSIATQDCNKNRQFIEIELIPLIGGG